ncbi:uncharacterized protein LOC144633013 [Oculina patagonica]
MGLSRKLTDFTLSLAIVFVSLANVSSQCGTDQMKTCPDGLCDDECETSSASASGVEAIVAIMSVSVVLILGLVILLVYICLKQGPWSQSGDANDSCENTCESTTVEIPEYLMRRRFSSLSMMSGPPPYFSLFRFFLNENGELTSTAVIGENMRTGNARLPSIDLPPDYGVLFAQSPPPYDHVIQREEPRVVGTSVSNISEC